MDDRKRTLAAITIIVGFIVAVVVIIVALVSHRGVVSPVPDESPIKIIYISPTGSQAIITPTLSSTPTPRPTPTKVISPTPKNSITPSVTVKPTITTTPTP